MIVVERPRNTDAVMNGIEAVRNALGACWFDERKCSTGISALEGYRAEYDEEKKILRNTPLHDHNSHGADGFRTFAVGYRPKRKSKPFYRQPTSPWAV